MNQQEINRNIEALNAGRHEYTIENGIARWTSNGNVPFADMIAAMIAIGEDLDPAANEAAREEQNARFSEQYIKGQANRTEEQIAEENYERRAAFGPGEKLINVITGEVSYS